MFELELFSLVELARGASIASANAAIQRPIIIHERFIAIPPDLVLCISTELFP